MMIWVVITNYLNNMHFGTYSTILNARKAIEKFIIEDDNIDSYEDTANYGYTIYTKNGKSYWFEIAYDIVDAELEDE